MRRGQAVMLPNGVPYVPSSHEFGEAAEVLVAAAYDGLQVAAARRGEDVIFPDRTHRQVKARAKSDHGVSRKIEIKSWDFQILMVILFDTDRVTPLRAGQISKRDLKRVQAYHSYTNNCPEYSLTKAFWASSGMVDITDDLLNRMYDRELSMVDIYFEFYKKALAESLL